MRPGVLHTGLSALFVLSALTLVVWHYGIYLWRHRWRARLLYQIYHGSRAAPPGPGTDPGSGPESAPGSSSPMRLSTRLLVALLSAHLPLLVRCVDPFAAFGILSLPEVSLLHDLSSAGALLALSVVSTELQRLVAALARIRPLTERQEGREDKAGEGGEEEAPAEALPARGFLESEMDFLRTGGLTDVRDSPAYSARKHQAATTVALATGAVSLTTATLPTPLLLMPPRTAPARRAPRRPAEKEADEAALRRGFLCNRFLVALAVSFTVSALVGNLCLILSPGDRLQQQTIVLVLCLHFTATTWILYLTMVARLVRCTLLVRRLAYRFRFLPHLILSGTFLAGLVVALPFHVLLTVQDYIAVAHAEPEPEAAGGAGAGASAGAVEDTSYSYTMTGTGFLQLGSLLLLHLFAAAFLPKVPPSVRTTFRVSAALPTEVDAPVRMGKRPLFLHPVPLDNGVGSERHTVVFWFSVGRTTLTAALLLYVSALTEQMGGTFQAFGEACCCSPIARTVHRTRARARARERERDGTQRRGVRPVTARSTLFVRPPGTPTPTPDSSPPLQQQQQRRQQEQECLPPAAGRPYQVTREAWPAPPRTLLLQLPSAQ